MGIENVNHVLSSVSEAKPQWTVVRDCIDGQEKVKSKGVLYLPMPNAGDQSNDNQLRYVSYKTRGVFVNMTARTLNGMVGTAFMKQPVCTLPDQLMIMYENVDGGAVTIDQQAKQVLSDALSVGRCGLLTDYPTTDGVVTQEQINKGEARPVIMFYFAEDIINWRYTIVASLRKLNLCVLREKKEVVEDEFKHTTEDQFRVLRLQPGENGSMVYTQEIVSKDAAGAWISQGVVTPTQADGKPFDYIPFEFVGSRNNDGGIDEVPLIGLANINLAHYRNSCDFEEMVFVVGQPTMVITGLTQVWAKDVLKGEVKVGSTSALMLPEGADAKYLEVSESQIALKAMEHKETQAVAIGAKLVSQNTVQRTAKEAGMDDASEQSVLMSAVYNVNSAYKRSLASAALFVGVTIPEDMGYEINTDFEIMQLDQASLAARVKMWVDGAITFSEIRSILKRADIATLEDEEARQEIKDDSEANLAAMGLEPPADPNADPVAKPAFGGG